MTPDRQHFSVTRTLRDAYTLLTQHLAPQQFLTRLMYCLTRVRTPWWKNWQIRWFIRRYKVDMSVTPMRNPEAYSDFNTFFTRPLLPGSRPLVTDPKDIACPVDGAVSELGDIVAGRLIQAKGQDYTLEALLGGNAKRAAPFQNGRFITLYLSPSDYHRIHMPRRGQLREMVYIPGRLFSVGPHTVRLVPGLFAHNERLVTIFDTDLGPMAMVLVGAMFVAAIETVWTGPIAPRGGREIRTWGYGNEKDETTLEAFERGAEVGRFNMGSTVIVLFGPGRVDFAPKLTSGGTVRVGQQLAIART